MASPSVFTGGLVAFMNGDIGFTPSLVLYPTIGYTFDDNDTRLSDISSPIYSDYGDSDALTSETYNAACQLTATTPDIPSGSGSVDGILLVKDTGAASSSIPLLYWSGSDVAFIGDSSTLTVAATSGYFIDMLTGGNMFTGGALEMVAGGYSLTSDDIRVRMMLSGYTFDASQTVMSDVDISAYNGPDSAVLASPSITSDAEYTTNNATWTAPSAGQNVVGIIVYYDNPAGDSLSLPICYIAKAFTTDGRDVSISHGANGWFQFGEFAAP